MTSTHYSNNCHNCKNRWENPDGHCYMWKYEPPVCLHWRIDERLLRDQLMRNAEAVSEERTK